MKNYILNSPELPLTGFEGGVYFDGAVQNMQGIFVREISVPSRFYHTRLNLFDNTLHDYNHALNSDERARFAKYLLTLKEDGLINEEDIKIIEEGGL